MFLMFLKFQNMPSTTMMLGSCHSVKGTSPEYLPPVSKQNMWHSLNEIDFTKIFGVRQLQNPMLCTASRELGD